MSLITTIQDSFNNNSIDALWHSFNFTSGNIVETGGELSLGVAATTLDSECGVNTESTYDFTGCRTSIRVNRVSVGNCFCDFGIQLEYQTLESSDENWVLIGVNTNTGKLQATKKIATNFSLLTEITYVPSTHRYWAMRELGNTTYWEYSATGLPSSWVTLWSETNPMVVTNAYALIDNYEYDNTTSPTPFVVDDFNIVPRSLNFNRLRPRLFSPGIAR